MKRFISIAAVICIVFGMTVPLFGFASNASATGGGETPTAASGNDVNITVVMPPEPTPARDVPDPLPPPAPMPNPNPPNPNVPALYPTDVYEFYDATSRQIIKTYELDRENPDGISRASFERDGWLYELTDITKKENAHAATREHTETVTVETASRDMDAIMKLLAPSIEYKAEDGYIGVLTLDIGSIAVEQSGTKRSSYTMTETREYPHLSSNDTSLVPKTITKGSVTYNLDSVTWQTSGGMAVDYDYIPTSYTAVAKYTATGSKTTVTGYNTTAEYKGTLTISKLNKNIKVYEGESLENMKKGIGHFEMTSAWDGNVGFAGHNRGAAAYFSFVKDLVVGDKITYTTKYGTRTYEVYRKDKISETDYTGLSWSAENIISLITCVADEPAYRFIVQAREVSQK